MPRLIRKDNSTTGEDFRIELDQIFKNFMDSPDATYTFPCTLDNTQRKYIHSKAQRLGLSSKSYGKEPNRCLRISKKSPKMETFALDISAYSRKKIKDFLDRCPPNEMPSREHNQNSQKRFERINTEKHNYGKLSNIQPTIPGFASNPALEGFRNNLPIASMKNEVMHNILTKPVTIICSETGSGKTTQIPQYILEYCYVQKYCCRVICTQPRRLSAVSVAYRVAEERKESVGSTVGYQIRLESSSGANTCLLYCTNGVLLRTLMTGDKCLNNITHIIIDEIHERDQFSDFLLISLRECLVNYPHLRLILMSATINIELFQNYFKNFEVGLVTVPGRQHPVEEVYLEDILRFTNYCNDRMLPIGYWNGPNETNCHQSVINNFSKPEISSEIEWEMNNCLVECTEKGTEDSFSQIQQLILSENAPVNYQHPEKGYTALIAAAMHGNLDLTEQLLYLNANTELTTPDGKTAYDWAVYYNKPFVAELLSNYTMHLQNQQQQDQPQNQKDMSMLSVYDSQTMEDYIDFELMVEILLYIFKNSTQGSVLVFLPGYDDIITAQQRIYNELKVDTDFDVYILHSSMDVKEQQRVFDKTDRRKLILSTNIAETSITINDVVFVIDSGKVKEKSYDAVSNVCSLKSNWISQACSKQRAGRAGRTQPGICYHMFSHKRYSSMQRYSTPEILRLPLRELCLQTKKLAPPMVSIEQFLSQALEPPSSISIQKSVDSLIELGALDGNETLTKLGNHLLQLSVDPHLGKMLIYSVVFKCVDPILTIVSCLSQKDAFLLPMQPNLKQEAFHRKKLLSTDSYSDHMAALRAFQQWQDARINGYEVEYCSQNYISAATMEMVVGFRSQLLGQLRALGFVKHKHCDTIRDLNKYADSWPLIKAAIGAGLYPNLAYIDKLNLNLRTHRENKIIFHMSSILRNPDKKSKSSSAKDAQLREFPSNWVLFEELSRMGLLCSIKCSTLITPMTVALVSSYNEEPKDEDIYEVNDWIAFDCVEGNANLVYQFKYHVNSVVNKKINNPDCTLSAFDEAILKTLREVLENEDVENGFIVQEGVGKTPKPFVLEARKNNFRALSANNGRRANTGRQYNKPNALPPMHPVNFDPNVRGVQEQFQNLNFQMDATPCSTSFMHRGHNGHYPGEYGNGNNGNNGRYDNNGPGAYRCNFGNDRFAHNSYPYPIGAPYMDTYVLPPNAVMCNIYTSKTKCIDDSRKRNLWIFRHETYVNLIKLVQEKKIVLLTFSLITSTVSTLCGLAQFMGTPADKNLECNVTWLKSFNIHHSDIKKNLPSMNVDFKEDRILNGGVANLIYSLYYQNTGMNSGIGRPILGGAPR